MSEGLSIRYSRTNPQGYDRVDIKGPYFLAPVSMMDKPSILSVVTTRCKFQVSEVAKQRWRVSKGPCIKRTS